MKTLLIVLAMCVSALAHAHPLTVRFWLILPDPSNPSTEHVVVGMADAERAANGSISNVTNPRVWNNPLHFNSAFWDLNGPAITDFDEFTINPWSEGGPLNTLLVYGKSTNPELFEFSMASNAALLETPTTSVAGVPRFAYLSTEVAGVPDGGAGLPLLCLLSAAGVALRRKLAPL